MVGLVIKCIPKTKTTTPSLNNNPVTSRFAHPNPFQCLDYWLPWRGTVYAVPQYPAVPVFIFAPSERMNVIG
jgi:hypothetical protein